VVAFGPFSTVVLGCWWCRWRASLSSAGGGVAGGRRLLLRGGRQAEVMEGGSSSLVRGKTFGVKRRKEWVCTSAGLQLGENNGVQNFFFLLNFYQQKSIFYAFQSRQPAISLLTFHCNTKQRNERPSCPLFNNLYFNEGCRG